MKHRLFIPSLTFLLAGLFACGDDPSPATPFTKIDPGKADSSAIATFVDFEFDGWLNSSSYSPQSAIEDQLLYTVGQLNGDRAVSRMDKLELTNVKREEIDGQVRISYHAQVVVAWGKRDRVPTSYELVLPRDMDFSAQAAFIDAYKDKCVDWSAHDVDRGTMWYYWRPRACEPQQDDVVRVTATVTPSTITTTGKYPEYHKVWEDETLKVVAVFGKAGEEGGKWDAGVSAFNKYVRELKDLLTDKAGTFTSTPAEVSDSPGEETPDVKFTATLADGKKIEVVALLVRSVRSASEAFYDRYESLSGSADLIAYNGHSGLGANIRMLARKGKWQTGQYAIVFMNGCDTYAYVDSALADAHAAVNPDDPEGTKYLDVITNALPSYFSANATANLALLKGLLSYEQPKTYESIFEEIHSSQVVLVSGEQDNVYVPGYGDDGPDDPPVSQWKGLNETGTVETETELRYSTETLPPGSYRFTLSGDNDADLYLRVGMEPDQENFDCRPFKSGSNEICEVEINSPAVIHLMVRGWDESSSFELKGEPAPNS